MNDAAVYVIAVSGFVLGWTFGSIARSLKRANRKLDDILVELREARHDRQMQWEQQYERENNSEGR